MESISNQFQFMLTIISCHFSSDLVCVHYFSCLFLILYRIGTSTRLGGPNDLQLERYVEALEDLTSGLTYYAALTGQRRQSVTDVEHLFGSQLLAFMMEKQCVVEAEYIEAVLVGEEHVTRGVV